MEQDYHLQQQEEKTVSDTIFSNIKKYENPEYQYLHLLEHVLEKGHLEEGRNGKVVSSFGHSMRFSLGNGTIPILTTKKVAWKTCLKELLWFISGKTDNKILQKQGVHIWDANASREFLQLQKLDYYEDGELGPIYGHQWRHFDAKWEGNNSEYIEKGIDQLQYIIDQLKNSATRTSRRLIMTAWNPKQLEQMALPPCHILCQFSVHDRNKLSCALYQRSADMCLGVPFNIASYCFLTHLLAKHCDLEAFEFVHFIGNAHIYENHIQSAKIQLQREPYNFPKVIIGSQRSNINDYIVDDFQIMDYNSYDTIKMSMVA
jgi:thymidylate synthase